MLEEYVFENRKYETTVRNLKSILFDVVVSENGMISELESSVSRENDIEKQKELKKLLEARKSSLKQVLEISSQLTDSLMQLDSCYFELNKLENTNIISNKEINEEIYNEEVIPIETYQQDVVDLENSDSNDQEDTVEEDYSSNEVEDVNSYDMQEESTEDDSYDEQEEIDSTNKDGVLETFNLESTDEVVIPTPIIANEINDSNESVENNESLIPNVENDFFEDANNMELPVVSNFSESIENQELVENTDITPVQKLKFVKNSTNPVKAIIATKKQITNLRNYRETSKALLNAKNSVVELPGTVNTTQTAQNNLEQDLINKGLLEPVVDKQRKIEEMLERANTLYKTGNIEEAQNMYNQISILNKDMQVSSK